MATLTRNPISIICIVMALIGATSPAAATLAEDEKDCAEELTNLATCIPFVSGSTKQPTKDCCDQTTKLKAAKPKCLCVLIKESTDPSMGLPINTTLALQMPAACKIDANISDCPSLLKIPADSTDARIFKLAANPPLASKSPSSTSSTASASDNTKTTSTSEATTFGTGSFSFVGFVLISLFLN